MILNKMNSALLAEYGLNKNCAIDIHERNFDHLGW